MCRVCVWVAIYGCVTVRPLLPVHDCVYASRVGIAHGSGMAYVCHAAWFYLADLRPHSILQHVPVGTTCATSSTCPARLRHTLPMSTVAKHMHTRPLLACPLWVAFASMSLWWYWRGLHMLVKRSLGHMHILFCLSRWHVLRHVSILSNVTFWHLRTSVYVSKYALEAPFLAFHPSLIPQNNNKSVYIYFLFTC